MEQPKWELLRVFMQMTSLPVPLTNCIASLNKYTHLPRAAQWRGRAWREKGSRNRRETEAEVRLQLEEGEEKESAMQRKNVEKSR